MLPLLYHAHHSHYREDIPFWLGLAAQAGSPVLELGCGTGRVLCQLAQAGYRTMGIDNNLPMLRFLRANLEPGLKYTPLLIAADITRFRMGGKFPLVILPCNTYSTLNPDERMACLSCIHGCLLRGGIFAVSMPNPKLLKKLPAESDAELEDEFTHPQTGNPVQVSSAWRRTEYAFEVSWIYNHLLPDGEVEHTLVKTTHPMTSLQTHFNEITRSGLSIAGTYGDFDRSELAEDSPHLIILAIRRVNSRQY